MKIAKSVSLICLMTLCGGMVDNAQAVNMTPQIRRLVNEKQEKMAALEKCEGKKKGFMIAGLSTIGLTAVGVALNIVQANKSSKLSDELDEKNKTLSDKQDELSKVNAGIEEKEQGVVRPCLDRAAAGVYVYEDGICYVSKICGTLHEWGVAHNLPYGFFSGNCGDVQIVRDGTDNNSFCVERVPVGTSCMFKSNKDHKDLSVSIDEIVNDPDLVMYPKDLVGIDLPANPKPKNIKLTGSRAKGTYSADVDEGSVLTFSDGTRLIVQHLRSDKYYGEKFGETALYSDTLYDDSQNDNVKKYCYCRIIEPAVSKWVFGFACDDGCTDSKCDTGCAGQMYNDSQFRKAVFNSFK